MIVIAIEGIDGSGKTVQLELLKKTLESKNLSVEVKSFPEYHSFFGIQIGKLLSGKAGITADKVDAKSMALWFAMDRWQSFKDYTPHTDVLLLNRYVLSNAVYQSIRDIDKGSEDILDWILELEHGQLNLPKPDLYIYLDVEPSCAGVNMDKKGTRCYVDESRDVYEASNSIQNRSRSKYLEYAQRMKEICIINCMRQGQLADAEEISQSVVEAIVRRGLIK